MNSGNLAAQEREVLLLAAEGLAEQGDCHSPGYWSRDRVSLWTRIHERTGSASKTQSVAIELGRIYRQSEGQLLRSTGLFKALVEGLEDFAIYMMDEDHVVVCWNPALQRLLQYGENLPVTRLLRINA